MRLTLLTSILSQFIFHFTEWMSDYLFFIKVIFVHILNKKYKDKEKV